MAVALQVGAQDHLAPDDRLYAAGFKHTVNTTSADVRYKLLNSCR